MMNELMEMIQTFGAPVALVLFFVWRDFRREDRLTARVDNLEEYVRGRFEQIVVNATSAMLNATAATRKCIEFRESK